MRFEDRHEAGKQLADRLKDQVDSNSVVFALPRGGVPVAHAIAEALGLPIEVVVVRKVGSPENREFGVGAVGEDGEFWADAAALAEYSISPESLRDTIESETQEVKRRVRRYRGEREPVSVRGKTAILVDDGLATGVTASAAARILRRWGAKRIVLAVPVCASETAAKIKGQPGLVDELVCLYSPDRFFAVSLWYEDFAQLSDEDVMTYLKPGQGVKTEEVAIPSSDGTGLWGTLRIPANPKGLVIFAHGSGSSRFSPRNMQVASTLNEQGIATLLFDLLTPGEARQRSEVFDIVLLASRLASATRWAENYPPVFRLPIAYFGASTGAAAAILAAAELGGSISGVVSRGGRPDLAEARLKDCHAPTLLLVGGDDFGVLELNEAAAARMPNAELKVIPGATHLFEESGALDEVSRRAAAWFLGCFGHSIPATGSEEAA